MWQWGLGWWRRCRTLAGCQPHPHNYWPRTAADETHHYREQREGGKEAAIYERERDKDIGRV